MKQDIFFFNLGSVWLQVHPNITEDFSSKKVTKLVNRAITTAEVFLVNN